MNFTVESLPKSSDIPASNTPQIASTLRFRRFEQVTLGHFCEVESPRTAVAYNILVHHRRSESHGHMELSPLARIMGICRNALYKAKEELSNRGVLKWESNGQYWIGTIPIHVEH
jgi:hypothetical protein